MNLLSIYLQSVVSNAAGSDSDGLLLFADGSTRQATAAELFAANIKMWQDDVYSIAARMLDAQSIGYSPVEVATWPAMQAEIIAYNSNGTVGPAMQAVIDRGRHTAATLSALLTPKITYQSAVLLARDVHIEAIAALPSDAQHYDTSAGWPSA